MNFFLRQATLSSSGGKSLIRLVAASLTASGVVYSYGNSDLDTSTSFSKSLYIKSSLPILNPIIHNFSATPSFDTSASFLTSLPDKTSLPIHNPIVHNYSTPTLSENNSAPSDPCRKCLGRNSIADAAARVSPAVVNISIAHELYGMQAGQSMGSGVLIDPDGTILTCAHVVASKGKVNVSLQDGRKFEGTVLNLDSLSDIAVLKVNCDWVVAVGSPFTLQNTVTAGIVSCVDRKGSDLGFTESGMEYLQTDCAVNSGNSGGPLVNIDGEIVGINAFKAFYADGLAFAVPIDSAIKVLEQFKKRGRVIRPWLGMKLIDLNKTVIDQLKERNYNFPAVSRGVLVPMVTPGSPAQRGGMVLGDVIVEFDGRSVGSTREIVDILGDRVGVPLKVVVKRAVNDTVTLFLTPQEAYCNG